ncbi:UNVERIFIED_CONTAM: hypothetical protein GTU68_045482, partial [Idotea baltica]|nr:hypothetical protein [Idotea baltica]
MDIYTKSHRRFNILTGEWILVSPHRTKRPWQGKKDKAAELNKIDYDKNCYLCPGNTRASGDKNPTYADTYSFNNDYAALVQDQEHERFSDGLLKSETEEGICKVVCFSPNHSLTLPLMPVEDITKVVNLWQNEYNELGKKISINHVQIFENKGAIMGCSNPHPHGQIWAQTSIPEVVLQKQKQQKKYWDTNNKSLLADYIQQEIELNERIILKNDHFVALIPYWAVWPYEAMIVPIKQYQHIGQLNTIEKIAFAEIIKGLTIKYDNLFQVSFPYSSGI